MSQLITPICGAREHDSIYIHIHEGLGAQKLPDPPATEVVNAAIALFAVVFPSQSPKMQEFTLEQLTTHLSAGSLQRAPGRRAAVAINTAMALLGALKVANGEMSADLGDMKHPAVEKSLEALLRVCSRCLTSLLRSPAKYILRLLSLTLTRICDTLDTKPWEGSATAQGILSRLMKSTHSSISLFRIEIQTLAQATLWH